MESADWENVSLSVSETVALKACSSLACEIVEIDWVDVSLMVQFGLFKLM